MAWSGQARHSPDWDWGQGIVAVGNEVTMLPPETWAASVAGLSQNLLAQIQLQAGVWGGQTRAVGRGVNRSVLLPKPHG